MNFNIICGIYKITSPSNRMYIGQSPDIYKRWRHYKNINCKNQKLLYRSLVKYGFEKHVFNIIEECDINKLDEREVYYISLYNTFGTKHGLNLTKGGSGSVGFRHTQETKDKVRKMAIGRVKSPETIKKIKQTLRQRYEMVTHHSKGKKQSNELIGKRVAKITGRKNTDETKRQMSAKAMGNTKWVGRTHSEDTKLKMSRSLLGKCRKMNSNIILNTSTGIFYDGVKDAASSVNISRSFLSKKLIGIKRNNTDFIYV